MEPYIWVGIILAVTGTVAELVRHSRMGSSKLMQAAEKEDLAEFRRILRSRRPKVDAPGALGNRPLHVAAGEWGREDLVEELIGLGATVDICNMYGRTPLYLAVENGNLDAVRVLLENDADAGAEDRKGVTPLEIALKSKRKGTIALLERYA